jgi:hypothetical protein
MPDKWKSRNLFTDSTVNADHVQSRLIERLPEFQRRKLGFCFK